MKDISGFEKEAGYEFSDKSLLKTALTHSSYAYERKINKCEFNERLEFLGDAVLELISSEYIYKKNPDEPEGFLTKTRASYVCEPTLAACAREIHLGKYLFLGKGEDMSGGRKRDSILSDALEATIGAVYLDGGFDCAKKYVERVVLKDIEKKKMFYDSKTSLQEIIQGMDGAVLEYREIGEEGPDHDKKFLSGVFINGEKISEGEGHTKKKSEQNAAYKAILKLQEKNESCEKPQNI